jgi:hypothetical protein
MPKGGFVYQGNKRTAADNSRKAKEGTRDYDRIIKQGIPMFKPKEGENCIRIMPGTWGEPDWDYVFHSHFNIGPDDGQYLCPAKMNDEPCACCDAKLECTDPEEADELSPRKGALCWIIDRDSEKTGPQVWAIPFTKVRNEILLRSTDKRSGEPILIDDPEEGYDIVFTREGTKKTTQYKGVEISRDPSPLCENEKTQAKWLDYITENSLPDILNFYPADYVEKVLMGKVAKKPADEEEGDEEQNPAPSRSTRRRPAAEEDEEQDPAPRSTRRRLPAADEEDEEQDPAPRTRRRLPAADEEEEDPAPRSTRRGRAPAEEEEEEETPRTRRRALLDDNKGSKDDDPPFDPETGEVLDEETPRSRRGKVTDEDTPVGAAKRSLERLKTRQRER